MTEKTVTTNSGLFPLLDGIITKVFGDKFTGSLRIEVDDGRLEMVNTATNVKFVTASSFDSRDAKVIFPVVATFKDGVLTSSEAVQTVAITDPAAPVSKVEAKPAKAGKGTYSPAFEARTHYE